MRRRTWKRQYAQLTVDDAKDNSRREELLLQHGFNMTKKYLIRKIDRKTLLFIQWQDTTFYDENHPRELVGDAREGTLGVRNHEQSGS